MLKGQVGVRTGVLSRALHCMPLPCPTGRRRAACPAVEGALPRRQRIGPRHVVVDMQVDSDAIEDNSPRTGAHVRVIIDSTGIRQRYVRPTGSGDIRSRAHSNHGSPHNRSRLEHACYIQGGPHGRRR